MNESIYRISLDIHEASSQAALSVKQGDNARKIYVSLTEGGKPYAISDGCTAKFRAKKPDGTVLYNDCLIDGNVIEYALTNQTSAVSGIVACEITLYGTDSKQITSPKFSMIVEETVQSDSEIESTNECTGLIAAIEACENLNLSVSKVLNTTVINVTKKDGTIESATVLDGEKGEKGEQGPQGPVASPIVYTTTFQSIAASLHKILIFDGDSVYNITKTTDELIVYIILTSNLPFNGWEKFLTLSSDNSFSKNKMTYLAPTGIWNNVSTINDGRVIPAGQALILHVKGSGTAGTFEFVHLLNLPGPV